MSKQDIEVRHNIRCLLEVKAWTDRVSPSYPGIVTRGNHQASNCNLRLIDLGGDAALELLSIPIEPRIEIEARNVAWILVNVSPSFDAMLCVDGWFSPSWLEFDVCPAGLFVRT